jgi:hypothetical protein
MEIFQIPTQGYDCIVTFKVTMDRPVILRVQGYDSNPLHINSLYFDRVFGQPGKLHPKGVKIIKAPLPISPDKLTIVAYDATNGSQTGIRISDVSVSALDKKIVAFNTPDDYEFFRFLENFNKRSGYTPPGSYQSENKKFTIKYSTVLYNDKGNPLTTPARVFRDSKIMEFSKPQFDKMTVPMRMFIGLHERAHIRVNTRDEHKADHYALSIYLGMGYPKSEAMYAFTKVFTPINENHEKAIMSRMDSAFNFMSGFKSNSL